MKKLVISLLVACTLVFTSMIPAANPSTKTKSAQKSPPAEKKTEKTPDHITWHKYDEGLKLAKKEGKKVFLEFTAKWCGYCKKMHATTFKDPEIIGLLDKYFISVSVDGDSRDSLNVDGWMTTEKALTRDYGVRGYPTYWFLGPESKKISYITGYRPKSALYDVLDYLKDDLYKTVSFADYLAGKKKEDKKP